MSEHEATLARWIRRAENAELQVNMLFRRVVALEQERNELRKELVELKSTLTELAPAIPGALAENDRLRKERNALQAKLDQAHARAHYTPAGQPALTQVEQSQRVDYTASLKYVARGCCCTTNHAQVITDYQSQEHTS